MKIDSGLKTSEGEVVPLQGVEVTGEVLGGYASVRVRQIYQNKEARPVEAIYTFPLPSDATLSGFSMTCAGRRLEGEVQEREKAFQTYDDALVAGHGAALLEQERPNVFTANVGNLLPGEETQIEIDYLQRVSVDEGALRWMIPTLVAPRYIPGTPLGDRTGHGWSPPTDQVPDADRITPPIGQVDYGLKLDLVFDLGRRVEVESPSHAIDIVREEGDRVRVHFAQPQVALDRDVVLNLRGIADGVFTTVAAHRVAGETGTVAVTVVPDLFGSTGSATAQEVVFMIDTSGSMEGASLEEARSALRLCLRHLREGDRFTILEFNTRHTWFAPRLVPFSQQTLTDADAWVSALRATGGTELLKPMLEAVRTTPDGIVVLLTDGQVGNEDEILRNVLVARGSSRIYSFGIGTNVSDVLLRDLATRTGGAVEFIHPGERIDEKVVAQFARAVAPRVQDLSMKFVGLNVAESAPCELPALVDGEPWVLCGLYENPGEGELELRGRLGREPFVLTVPIVLPAEASRPAVTRLWASARIRDFEHQALTGRRADAMRSRIVDLSVTHKVASKYTSFVVVERREGERRVVGAGQTRVVPVNAPAGWAMFDRGVSSTDTRRARSLGRSAAAGAAAPVLPSGVPAFPSPMPASPPSNRPVPPPPPSIYAEQDSFGSSGVEMSRQRLLEPPAEALSYSQALRREKEEVRPAKKSAMRRALDFLGGATVQEERADYEQHRAAPVPAAPVPVAPVPAAPVSVAPVPAAPVRQAPDSLITLLSRQLASGLWNEPEGGARGAAGALRATALALLELSAQGITTSHALHGAQVRKAIDALLENLSGGAGGDSRLLELALGAAWLAATGRRTRSRIEGEAGNAGLTALVKLFGDENAMRNHLEGVATGRP